MGLHTYSAVETNDEMYDEVMRLCREFKPDVAIFSAAVLDFAPTKKSRGKVSSRVSSWTVHLKPTKKIIDGVGRKFPRVRRIGFKLEWVRSKDKEGYAAAFEALDEKKLDAVCLNFLSEIAGDAHPAIFITRDGEMKRAENKPEIAALITEYVTSL